MFSKKLFGGVAVTAMSFALAPAALAQETTTSVRGAVLSPDGAPAAGAQVTVLHEPTGTVAVTETNSAGVFDARGLRVGGPYTVTVETDGFATQTVTDVYLSLGEATRLDFDLTVEGEVITVTASRRARGEDFGGQTQLITAEDVRDLTAVNRDFKELVGQNSIAFIDYGDTTNPITIAGQNPRCNSFMVNGLPQNDGFGLNRQGYPTARSPLPFEWTEAVQVALAPYDVEYNDFCGGVINVVTKTGSNAFHGTLEYFYKDQDMVGNRSRDQKFNLSPFEEKEWGFTVGGPIIKDKLFFFVGYNEIEAGQPIDFGPSDGGLGTAIAGVTQAQVDQIVSIAQSEYGFDAGTVGGQNIEENKRWMAKIDWNINDDHRATFAYQYADGGTLSTRFATSTPRVLGLSSNWYRDAEELTGYTLQLNSNWTDIFSTELRYGKLEIVGQQAPLNGADFPEIYVRTDGTPNTNGGTYVALGPDQFRHANELEYAVDIFRGVGTLQLDRHVVKFGYERRMQDILNVFVEGSDGIYRFESIANFQNRILGTSLNTGFREGRGREPIRYANAPTNDPVDASAVWELNVDSLFVQDSWDVSNQLNVTGGLRYDRFSTSGRIVENARFKNTYGFANTAQLDGLDIVLPRLDMRYDFENLKWVDNAFIRAGVGRFSGGEPRVWVSNNYSNDGVSYVQVQGTPTALGLANTFLQDPANEDLNQVPQVLQDRLETLTGNSPVNALDPNFELPSQWRANVGFDFTVGNDWQVGLEGLVLVGQDQLTYRDLNSVVSGSAPDGRLVYRVRNAAVIGADLLLTNTDKSVVSRFFTANVARTWEFDGGDEVTFKFGYTNGESKDIGVGTSSTASSNFTGRSFTNFNEPESGRSSFDREHRYVSSVKWRKSFFGELATTFQLQGQHMSGMPFSYTFSGSPFGGNQPANGALLYVPKTDASGNITATSDPIVTYGANFNVGAFNDFAKRTGLIGYAGSIVPRNAFDAPDSTRFDFKVSQELPGFLADHRTRLELNIYNVGNLINEDWGRLETANFSGQNAIVGLGNVAANSTQYAFNTFNANNGVFFRQNPSLWQVLVGIKYEF